MRLSHLVVGCAIGLAVAGCSRSRETAAKPAGMVEDAVSVSAKVVRVEPKRRLVTLEMPDGSRVTTRAHASVKDLEKLKAGDVVSAAYYESVAFDVKPAGKAQPGVAAAEDVVASPPGAPPAAADARSVTVTAKVTKVDAKAGRITLEAPDASPVTMKVKDPALLKNVERGDLLEVTFTEAVAVAIEPSNR